VPQTPIPYEDVEIVRQTDLGIWVRIGPHQVFVGRAVPLPGTTICQAGDRGRLVVPRWFAEQQGLPVRTA
jgi:hypothetical protein